MRMRTQITAFTALFCHLALGGDWPQFRGPQGQGHAETRGLPVEWATNRNVTWKQEIPGAGWSSPIVWKGRVFLTTAVKPEGGGPMSLRALGLDATSGQQVWSREVFSVTATGGHQKNGHASPTPVTDGRRLYVHFGHYGTAALDLDGKVLWRNNSLKYPPVHGNGGSPILAGDALVFSADGSSDPFIAALDQASGKLLWRTPRSLDAKKKFSFSTPLAIEVNGTMQIISPASAGVYAYRARDGKELWRARYAEGYSVVPRPVFGHGLVFVSSAFDRPVVYALKPDGAGDVTDTHIAWSINRGAPNTPSMLLVAGDLYFVSDSGLMSCADARTGQVHWQERLGGNYSASPVFADGRIYVTSEEGVTSVVQPGRTFTVLAKNDLRERTLASPAMVDGAIFLRTSAHLFRIEGPAAARK